MVEPTPVNAIWDDPVRYADPFRRRNTTQRNNVVVAVTLVSRPQSQTPAPPTPETFAIYKMQVRRLQWPMARAHTVDPQDQTD